MNPAYIIKYIYLMNIGTYVFFILDYLLFILFTLVIFYLFAFALLSKKKRANHYRKADKQHRFAVLFPAYKEDRVILHSVESFLQQNYPRYLYDVIVISDHMQMETNTSLEEISAKVLEVKFEKSSKAKALNFAIDSLDASSYDIVVIFDADNIVDTDFLEKINDVYSSGRKSIQAHRTAKNTDTDMALLDAISEEINNSIFRKGQTNAGFSAALSGSGMAFDYTWFANNIKEVSSSGEDKEIEALLLKQKIFIEYLHEVTVLDEKVQNSDTFYNQRQRWIAAQYAILAKALKDLPKALSERNFDYCNKIIQWIIPPRILLLGSIGMLAVITTVVSFSVSLKWWGLLFLLLLTFFVAIPDHLLNKRLCKAIVRLPWLFTLMVLNLFRLKGANKNFNRTEHTH